MDFFERAHVVRMPENKPKKHQDAMKKQLKMMLHGYKTSDNELIKEAENIKVDLDDSTSVSGFSDLNLTTSSIEDSNFNESYESGNSENKSESYESIPKHNISQQSLSSSKVNTSSNHTSTDDDMNETTSSVSFDNNESISTSNNSVSGYDDDISSLTDISLISRDVPTDEDTNSSDSLSGSSISEFDPTGELAIQIHEKLKSQEDLKKEKRKIFDIEPLSVKEKSQKDKSKEKRNKKKDHNFISIPTKKIIDIETSPVDATEPTKAKKCRKSETIGKSDNSPPYESITATDIKEQSFNEILGEYKYSTIKNLPSDNQNAIFSFESSNFPADIIKPDLNVSNIDEVSSLVPEVDNDLSVSDLVEIDTSLLTVNESILNEASMTNDPIQSDLSFDVTNDTQLLESNNINNYNIYFGNNNVIIILKHPSELFFHGKLIVKALAGKVEVFGYALTEKDCPIIAPVYTYAQCFKTVENSNDNYHLFGKLTAVGISSQDAEEIVVNIGENDGIVVLKPMKCPKMEFVAQNFSTTNLFKNNHKEKGLERASNILGCSLYSARPQKFFEENTLWQRVIPCNQSNTRGIVCGGKGSGKSTFLRYYVNQLIDRGPILVIDLDPGQSEFTVAGNISATVVDKPIFGPSFTHLRKPNRCLNIGIISTMDNTQRYANAVKSIISYSRDNFTNITWIINTMGMTNAVGLKFITLIITLTQPNFVLQYDSRNPKKRFDTRLTAVNVTELLRKFRYDRIFTNVPSSCTEYSLIMAPEAQILTSQRSSLIPRDERYLNFLAYFAELIKSFNHLNSWLLGVTPYEVKLKDLFVAVNVRLKEDCITKVINGKVVALCQQATQCRDARVFTLADKPLLCLGHGLIRGIDWEKEVMYVITPLGGDELCSVNTIVYADWVPELRGQESHLPDGTKVPYRTTAQHQSMKLMTAPRRRFNPMQLLKMTRNS